MQTLETKIELWSQAHPYTVYGDYNDKLSDDLLSALVKGELETFDNLVFDYECDATDYIYTEARREALEALGLTEEDVEDIDFPPLCYDFSDYWRTAIRNTSAHVTVYFNLSEAQQALFDTSKAEQMYPEYEELCICGKIDLQAHYEAITSGKGIKSLTITPSQSDNLLFHATFNGSGNMGDIVLREALTLPAEALTICLDGYSTHRKYGVQDVYGFTHNYWNRCELQFEYGA